MQSRATRRAPAASARFLAASRRSAPLTWLIGGIGGCFAAALAFVLLGGSPPVDTLPEAVAALESKARTAESEGRTEEAVGHFQELVRLVGGREDFKTRAMEWRRVIRDLQAEAVDLKKLDAEFQALKNRAAALAPNEARALYEELARFQIRVERSKRPWLKDLDGLVKGVKDRIPQGPPSWQEMQKRIVENRRPDKRGEAQWGGALRDWKDYLKLALPEEDRRGAENAMKAVEQKAREEVASLKGRKLPAEELRKHRLRFEGTAAAPDLDKAIEGK